MQSFSMWKYPDRNTIVFNFQDFRMTLLSLWPMPMVQSENTRRQAFSNWLFPTVISDLNPGIIKELRKRIKPIAANKTKKEICTRFPLSVNSVLLDDSFTSIHFLMVFCLPELGKRSFSIHPQCRFRFLVLPAARFPTLMVTFPGQSRVMFSREGGNLRSEVLPQEVRIVKCVVDDPAYDSGIPFSEFPSLGQGFP